MRTSHAGRRVRLFAVWALVVVFLAIALHGTDVDVASAALAEYAWWRIPVVMALLGVSLLARTERYRRLVPTRVPFGTVLAVSAASFLAINVVPLRMGELVRPYLLRTRGVPLPQTIAAVVLERVLDMIALLILVLTAAWLFDAPPIVVSGIDVLVVVRVAMGMSVAGAVALGVILHFGGRPLATLVPRAAPLVRRVDEALASARAATKQLPVVAATTALSWIATTAACGVAMGGFAQLEVSLASALVTWAAILAGIVLVPTPGFLGGFEAAALAALVAQGRDPDVARAFALVLHGAQFAFNVLVGTIGFAVLGVRPGEAVRASQEVE